MRLVNDWRAAFSRPMECARQLFTLPPHRENLPCVLCCVQIARLCCFSCARTVEWGGWVTWRGRLTMFVLNLSELKKQPLTDWSKISSTRRGQLILGWLSLWYLYSILTSDNAWLGQMFNIEDRDTNTWKISDDFGKIWDKSSKVTARYDTGRSMSV